MAVTDQMNVSINKRVRVAIDAALTPAGFITPPRGSYSALLQQLFARYVSELYDADLDVILDWFEANPNADYATAKLYFESLKNGK